LGKELGELLGRRMEEEGVRGVIALGCFTRDIGVVAGPLIIGCGLSEEDDAAEATGGRNLTTTRTFSVC